MVTFFRPRIRSAQPVAAPVRAIPRQNRSKRIVARILFAAVIVADFLLGLYALQLYYVHPRTDDAYVRANTVAVAPQVSGTIVELPVRDNQHVKAGDLLFVVDPRPYQAELELAKARLALTNLNIDALKHAIAAAQARQKRAEAEASYDQQYLARIIPLEKQDFVTANEVASARSKLAAARAAVEDARNEVAQAQKQLGQFGDINARRQAAEAEVYKAQLNVGYCYVRARFDAYVTNLNISVGQYANEGKEVMSLVDNRKWYVMANFRETFLPHIATGMKAQVYLLGYPHHRFEGVVEGVGWALYQQNGASVAGLPEVAPSLNWVRLAQRFPVRITLNNPGNFPFRMGATAVVTIEGKQ
jgi:multidrug efflux system membrane fusion protein